MLDSILLFYFQINYIFSALDLDAIILDFIDLIVNLSSHLCSLMAHIRNVKQ